MKMPELKDLTLNELAVKGREFRQELFHLRIQKATSAIEKPSRIRQLRKDIARIETQMTTLRHKAATK